MPGSVSMSWRHHVYRRSWMGILYACQFVANMPVCDIYVAISIHGVDIILSKWLIHWSFKSNGQFTDDFFKWNFMIKHLLEFVPEGVIYKPFNQLMVPSSSTYICVNRHQCLTHWIKQHVEPVFLFSSTGISIHKCFCDKIIYVHNSRYFDKSYPESTLIRNDKRLNCPI